MVSWRDRPASDSGRGTDDADSGSGKGDERAGVEAGRTVRPRTRHKPLRLRRSRRLQGAPVRWWSKPPWRKLPKPPMVEYVLRRWRKWAFEAATAKGARRSCDLCKRATMGCARVEVYQPWPGGVPKIRVLCSEHWRLMTTMLDDAAYKLDNYDMPIDWVQQYDHGGDNASKKMEQDPAS